MRLGIQLSFLVIFCSGTLGVSADENSVPPVRNWKTICHRSLAILGGLSVVSAYPFQLGVENYRVHRIGSIAEKMNLPPAVVYSSRVVLLETYHRKGWGEVKGIIRDTWDEIGRLNNHRLEDDTSGLLWHANASFETRLGPYLSASEKDLHIGLNILFDRSSLPRTNTPMAVVQDYFERLYNAGKSHDTDDDLYYREKFSDNQKQGVFVEKILKGEIASNCRHRSLILYSVFKHYGLPAKWRAGHLGGRGATPGLNHMWVEYDGKAYDPANFKKPVDVAEYQKRLVNIELIEDLMKEHSSQVR